MEKMSEKVEKLLKNILFDGEDEFFDFEESDNIENEFYRMTNSSYTFLRE